MTLTLLKASEEFGVARETLRRGLAKLGIQCEKGRKYTIRECHLALAGDLEKARAREAEANAIAKERDNRVADGELIPQIEVLKMLREALMPVRQRLLALPSEVAVRCNPVDSKLARDALQRWSDDALAAIRAEIPQPKTK